MERGQTRRSFQNSAHLKVALITLLAFFSLLFSITLSEAHPTEQNSQTNIVSNGNFEDGAENWTICGGSAVVEKGTTGVLDTNIQQGNNSLRLGNPTTEPCIDEFFFPRQIAYQQISVPADVEALTLSFWYTRRGSFLDDVSSFEVSGELLVYLMTDPFEGILSSPIDMTVAEVTRFDQRGWHYFRHSLDAEELTELRSGLAENDTLYIVIGMSGFLEDEVYQSGEKHAYYIDSVELVTENIVTEESPLPADLAAIDDQPIILTKYDPNHPNPVGDNSFSIFRMNPDGSDAVPIYPGQLAVPSFPTWSNDGQRIAAEDRIVSNPLNIYSSGLISALSTFNPDGSTVEEIFRTIGGGGNLDPSLPPELQLPNVHSRITGIEWSPDDSQIVVTTCFMVQGTFGFSDETCKLQFRDSTTGEIDKEIESGFRVDWNNKDQLLFGTTAFGELVPGIYEIDLNQNNEDSPTLLVRNWSNDIPFHGDSSPSWAPDNRHFAISREVPGTYRDGEGSLRSKNAIVLFDREQLPTEHEQPEFLLLVDHGELLGNLVWSPDGKYLLYNLFTYSEDKTFADVWWLEVETGKTGKLTNDGLSAGASWRPAGGGAITPPAVLNQRIYLPLLVR